MAYESKVRAVIYGEPDKLNAFYASQKLQGHEVFAQMGEGAFEIHEEEGKHSIIEMRFDDWGAWRAADHGAWRDLADKAEEAGLQHEFIRIGEDVTDFETRCSDGHEGLLWLDRRIGATFDPTEC